ncbi:hypothetical protein EON80_18700 [bacterium]|nr:MAG: hypothetical protein EON80_18700 [bacterium]
MLSQSVVDLRATLSAIEQAIGGAASKAPRSQILKTIVFLDEHLDKSVEELVAKFEADKPPPKTKAPAKTRTAKPKLPTQMQIVDEYVSHLKLAESALDAFNALMVKLKADKSVRLDELKVIASSYSGDRTSLKSKVTALGVIQRAFDTRWTLRQHAQQTSTSS